MFPNALNQTYISLIPKKKNPENVFDFCTISLCNILYKIIVKVLANRLILILPWIIFSTQSAFMPGWLITVNIFITYETMHYLNQKRESREPFMSLKLDMSKAYNRVEWFSLKI